MNLNLNDFGNHNQLAKIDPIKALPEMKIIDSAKEENSEGDKQSPESAHCVVKKLAKNIMMFKKKKFEPRED